jgi:hypothetical protein
MNIIKFSSGLLVLALVLSCNRITERVEQKVNEKIDKTIEENMNKIDSGLKKSNIDSLKKAFKNLDSVLNKEDKNKARKK